MNLPKDFAPANRRARVSTRRSGVILGALPLVAAFVFFFYIGKWLVVEDPLDHAQAIAILSGRMPARALEAAKLYRAGYAPEIWLTHSTEPGKSLEAINIQFFGEEYYDTKILIHDGVPPSSIRVLEPPILNTADEIIAVKAALNTRPGPSRTVILVTSKPHTRRVRTLWRELTRGQGRAIVHAATQDSYDAAHWWRTTSDALDVVREVLGLLNAWAGLPLAHS